MASNATSFNNKKPFASVFEKAKKKKKRKRDHDVSGGPKEDSEQVLVGGGEDDNSNSPKKKKKKQRPPKTKQSDDDSQPNNKGKKSPLSREALELSSKLKECSRNKNLKEALTLYWDSRNDKIRDQFHASITIDCCARCGGALDQITRILDSIKEPASVETNTGAIKFFSHGGYIRKAFQLFESMLQQKKAKLKPNIRTMNTLLRGCLWTAATLNDQDQICGGVVTAESAWNLFDKDKKSSSSSSVGGEENTSPPSYEYTISLLCQALRRDEAEQRIWQFQKLCGIKVVGKLIKGGDQSSLETLAISYAALARAHALLGEKDRTLDACNLARRMIKASGERQPTTEEGNDHPRMKGEYRASSVGGSKRAWKRDNDERRVASNTMFRDHRMSELEINLQYLVELCQSGKFPPPKEILATRILNGLFYFSGGGTTQLTDDDTTPQQKKGKEEYDQAAAEAKNKSRARQVRRQVVNSSWLSFGLRAAVDLSNIDVKLSSDFLRVKDSERIFRVVGKNPKAIQDDGYLDFQSLFPSNNMGIDIELGSGYGEWIVNQASFMPYRGHVAVELRADRVHHIFSKGMLHPSGHLQNLAVVGDDGLSFLETRVKPNSISTVFANHPEPPTQVQGKSDRDLQAIMEGNDEPAHMLSSKTLIAAGKVLEDEGRIIIVTDNMNYARLLCATVVRINRQESFRLRSCKPKALGLREVDSFLLNESNPGDGRVILMEGQPSSTIGHAEPKGSGDGKGSSYFDRLWRTGVSGHASNRERYILVLEQHK